MKSRFLPVIITLLFSPALFAQDYEIKLDRPDKVGDQYQLDATAGQVQDLSVTANGNPVKNDKKDITGHCTGVLKILEVDDKQRQTKTTLTIDKFTKTEGGVDSELLPQGTVVTSSVVNKKEVHEINGQPASPEVSQLLTMIVDLSKGEKGDDAIMGTKERKKKGDSWDINAELAKQDFAESTGGGKMDDLVGKTTLDDVEGDSLKISAHVVASLQPPLPPSFTLDSSSLDASFGGLFPIDTTKYIPEQSLKIAFSFSAHGDAPSGEKIVMSIKANMSVVRKRTALK